MSGLLKNGGGDPVLQELLERLTSLDNNCLRGLQEGLVAASRGDLTVEATPVTKPIESTSRDATVDAIVKVFNSMLQRAQDAIAAFNEHREQYRAALGDQSSIDALTERMTSLHDNCLTELQAGLADVAEGDLTHEVVPCTTPITRVGDAEIGSMAELFNSMLGKAQAAIEGYESMRGNTIVLVDEIARTSEQLGESARQVAQVSEEAGRAVTEIAGTIESVADGSSQQAQSVGAVNANVEDASGLIGRLGQKSQEIGDIVSAISGIASQTNLLALNAAIEAARAGEQGRGFAVVADEVRKLAEGAQASASSISALIGEVQAETARAVEAMATVQDDVAGVASVSEENAAAAEQVSASTEETSAATEEVAAQAEQVANAAQDLRTAVERFTTR